MITTVVMTALLVIIIVFDQIAEINDQSWSMEPGGEWLIDWIELQKQLEGYRTLEYSVKYTFLPDGEQQKNCHRMTCPISDRLITLDDLIETAAKWSSEWTVLITTWFNDRNPPHLPPGIAPLKRVHIDPDWIFGYDLDKQVAKLYLEYPDQGIDACECDKAGRCSWKYYRRANANENSHVYDYHLIMKSDKGDSSNHYRLAKPSTITSKSPFYTDVKPTTCLNTNKIHWTGIRNNGHTIYYRQEPIFKWYLQMKTKTLTNLRSLWVK